jgi:hypothetical protein
MFTLREQNAKPAKPNSEKNQQGILKYDYVFYMKNVKGNLSVKVSKGKF